MTKTKETKEQQFLAQDWSEELTSVPGIGPILAPRFQQKGIETPFDLVEEFRQRNFEEEACLEWLKTVNSHGSFNRKIFEAVWTKHQASSSKGWCILL